MTDKKTGWNDEKIDWDKIVADANKGFEGAKLDEAIKIADKAF